MRAQLSRHGRVLVVVDRIRGLLVTIHSPGPLIHECGVGPQRQDDAIGVVNLTADQPETAIGHPIDG